MRKSKYTEEQIVYALRQAKGGTRVSEICRKIGISEIRNITRSCKHKGLGVSELRRLKQLEEENKQLEKLVADLSLDKQMLQEVIAKKLQNQLRKRNW